MPYAHHILIDLFSTFRPQIALPTYHEDFLYFYTMSPSKILAKFKSDLGEDYHAYVHHVKRVYEYACILRLEKENERLKIAAIFHDLDIWHSQTMDYLKGSATLAGAYIQHQNLLVDIPQVEMNINRHHQITKIKDNPEAEAFRKADLIDLTSGWIHFNIPKSIIVDTERRYPRLGFTSKIAKRSIQWSLRHPFRPLPMIRW